MAKEMARYRDKSRSGELSGERWMHRVSAREVSILISLAIVAGLVSGISAIVLNLSVHSAVKWINQFHGSIWMIFLPAAGAALSALYLRNWLRDSAGHGVPEIIRSVTMGGGRLRLDMIYSRLISSFLTVSSGGSAGLEGPIATSGGAIGSALGRFFRLSERRRILMVGYGVAGAVAAIFNAPLTGTVFALEVILREWSPLSILPTVIAAVSATQFSRLVMGNQIAFHHEIAHFSTVDLLACVVMGLALGLLSTGFQRGLRITEKQFDKLKWPHWLKAGVGGLLVGIGGYFMPSILHDGYLAIETYLSGVAGLTLVGVIGFLALKYFACCITLGSGGSGGVFAPALVLGSSMGYGFGLLVRLIVPGMALATPAAYSLVGMAGTVAGVMHAPLTGMFLVLEITGGYDLILPLMIVSVLAMLLGYYFEEGSVYTRELVDSGLLARRGSDLHLLQTMDARELLDAEDIVLHEGMLLGEFVEVFKSAKRNVFPVVEKKSRRWLGVVYLDDIRAYLFDQSLYNIMNMGSVTHSDLPIVDPKDSVLSAIEKFNSSGAWTLPMVENGKFLGMLSKSTLFDRYRSELVVHTAE